MFINVEVCQVMRRKRGQYEASAPLSCHLLQSKLQHEQEKTWVLESLSIFWVVLHAALCI